MDIKNNFNAAMLLYDGFIRGKSDFAKIPFYAQKNCLMEKDKGRAFARSTPDREGVDSARLLAFVRAVSGTPDAAVHSLVLLANGKEIFSASAPGYDTRMPHGTFSMCKTVTAIAVGMLIDEGRLSLKDHAYRFFPELTPLLLSARTRAITVEHLLTMSAGVSFNEAGAVVETDWVRSYFESAVRFAPGKKFAYNSMNSYILAAIVSRVCGTSLSKFLKERLFDPLGIDSFFWEKCPSGTEKGGWGLYLSTESMAKIGQLFLNGGTYGGKRILSKEWIEASTQKRMDVSDAIGDYNYGYHLWIHKRDGSYLFNGMLGQNVRIDPPKNTVLAITAGDTCLFQYAHSLMAAEKLLGGEHRPKRGFSALYRRFLLQKEKKHFGEGAAWLSYKEDREELAIRARYAANGLFTEHAVSVNNAALLPMIVRLLQNNYTGGLRAVTFKEDGSDLLLTFAEREATLTVRAGKNRLHAGVINVQGELYRVMCAYNYTRDENRVPVLKVQIIFPELFSDRRLIVREDDGHLTLSLLESPNFTFVEKVMTSAHLATGQGGIVDFLKEKINIDGLLLRASTVFSPTVRLRSLSLPMSEAQTDDPLKTKLPIPNTVLPSLADTPDTSLDNRSDVKKPAKRKNGRESTEKTAKS